LAFVRDAERKADVDDAIIADFSLWHISQADFLDNAPEIHFPPFSGYLNQSPQQFFRERPGTSHAPIGAKVVAVNEKLAANPEILNSDPYGEGWMLRVEGTDVAGLMEATAYSSYCEGRAH